MDRPRNRFRTTSRRGNKQQRLLLLGVTLNRGAQPLNDRAVTDQRSFDSPQRLRPILLGDGKVSGEVFVLAANDLGLLRDLVIELLEEVRVSLR